MTADERQLVMSQLADIGAHLEEFPNPDALTSQLLSTIRQLTMICMMLLEEMHAD